MDLFDKLTRLDADRTNDEVDRDTRKALAKPRKRTLPTKDITIPNDYRPLDWDKLNELLPDFEANGIRERIEVFERGSRYILLHGRLRLEAAKRLKFDEIKTLVITEWRPKVERKKAPKGPLPNELELVKKARKGDEAARNKLVEHYYRVATTVAGKNKKKMEYAEADSVAFDAICKAIDTWNPKMAKLSTWIGQKVQGELTALRRQLRGQNRQLDWNVKERWIHRSRNTRVVPLESNVVRIERIDNPSAFPVKAKLKKRKCGIDKHPGEILCQAEIEMRAYRRQVRAEHHLDTLARILKENPHFDAWRKRRKGFNVNKQDQRIAELLFFTPAWVSWTEKIGGKDYFCHIAAPQEWLPDEICDELGITRSKFNAALTRICKAVTGFTDKELLALDDVRSVEREGRVQATPVPEPNLPHGIRKALTAIGQEPTFDEAANVVAEYWRRLVVHIPGDLRDCVLIGGNDPRQRQIALEVSEAIKGRTGPDYIRMAQCIEVLKRGR